MILTEEPRQVTTDLPEVQGRDAEALIKEARRHQRLRWLSMVVAALILAVVSVALVTHFTSPAKKTTTPTVTKPTTAVPTCFASQLLAANGPTLGGAIEERSFTLTLTNRGHRPCALEGYPRVLLFSAAGTVLDLPQMSHSQYITTASPRRVVLAVGATGYALVAKYGCVLGNLQTASQARLILLGIGASTTFTIPIVRTVGDLALCKGGRSDPGNSIAVSPVEATLSATLPDPQRS
jgi:hypothetical protein